jgi:hypothetical protein
MSTWAMWMILFGVKKPPPAKVPRTWPFKG